MSACFSCFFFILMEKQYQTLDTVLNDKIKHLAVRQNTPV